MERPEKLFTLEEAARTLPLVNVIVRDIRSTFARYSEQKKEIGRLRHDTILAANDRHAEAVAALEESVRILSRTLKTFVNELTELGVLMKDPVEGIVDFPFDHDGEVAYLCWRFSDESISTWHRADEAVEDRHPLDETILAAASDCS